MTTHHALATQAQALKGLGRREEALAIDRQAVALFPASGVAWHNMAATLGDLGRAGEARAACEEAFARGLDAPETWSVYARSLLALGDHDAAEAAYAEIARRAPRGVGVAIERANVAWMRRGVLEEALAALDACFAAGGDPAPLIGGKATLLEAAGEPVRAADLLARAAEMLPDDLSILLGAAHSAMVVDRMSEAERFLALAERLQPDADSVLIQAAVIHLAAGRPEVALAKVHEGLRRRPQDQALLGWAATAARAAGDPLHAELYDFAAMVRVYDLATPPGWPSLAAYLDDLAAALDRLHLYRQHPANQSLRQGSQTLHLLTGSDDPAIMAFFAAIGAPIRDYMAKLGPGSDPLRARNNGDYRIKGAWSVRLRPHGFHRDHFHAQGWLSSAFYVRTPDAALDRGGREGWIRFGKPPFRTEPALEAEHFVRPRPGRLVLFPSYLWHGTVPFTTDEDRLTMAFDAVPA